MPETDLRARSAADYLRMLQHLLPQGQAWTRAPGAVLTAVLQASADELERLDMAMRLLLMEILPTSAIAGLEDWERVLGLPDACLPAGTTLQERRSAVLAKLHDEGRQDLAYWYVRPDAGGDPGPSRDRLSGRAGDPLVVERHRPRRPAAPLPLRREPVR